MAVLVDKKIKSPQGYHPSLGGFWTDNQWLTCRVTFQDRIGKNGDKSFFYREKSTNSLVKVITEVEELLKLPEKYQVRFTTTDQQGYWKIEPGEWWFDPVRFTLLTAF